MEEERRIELEAQEVVEEEEGEGVRIAATWSLREPATTEKN